MEYIMFKNLKILIVFVCAVFLLPVGAKATDVEVGAEADFVEAIALLNVVDMDFNQIEYSPSTSVPTFIIF